MPVGNAGLIIIAVALLLCLCFRRAKPFHSDTEAKKNRRIMKEIEQWRNGL